MRKKFKYSNILLTGVLRFLDRSADRSVVTKLNESCNLLTGVLRSLDRSTVIS